MDTGNMSDTRNKLPEVVVFAGPNGSGKSTITGPEWIKGQYINADDLKRENGLTDLAAAELADTLRNEALSRGVDFTFETVLSTQRKLDFLQLAREKGYFIRGYFVLTTSPMVNIGRVKEREMRGLHGVPPEKIISRYEKALLNIPRFLRLCDICHIYDNTDNLHRIVRKHKSDITFFENEYWSLERIQDLILTR